MNALTGHLNSTQLALLAAGDLILRERVLARLHLALCPDCRHELAGFDAARDGLRVLAGVALPLDWDALESEMRANIRLGLTAGALTGAPEPRVETAPRPWRWAAVAMACGFVLVAGLLLNRGAGPVVSENAASRIAAPAAQFELLPPASRSVSSEADFAGAARTRSIDSDTGQVTLQQVYLE